MRTRERQEIQVYRMAINAAQEAQRRLHRTILDLSKVDYQGVWAASEELARADVGLSTAIDNLEARILQVHDHAAQVERAANGRG